MFLNPLASTPDLTPWNERIALIVYKVNIVINNVNNLFDLDLWEGNTESMKKVLEGELKTQTRNYLADKIQEALEALQQAAHYLRATKPMNEISPANRALKYTRQPNATEAISEIFKKEQKPIRLNKLFAEIEQRGLTVKKRSIAVILTRDARFFNFGRGVWGLSEWHEKE